MSLEPYWVVKSRFGQRYVADEFSVNYTTTSPQWARRYKKRPRLRLLGRLFFKPVLRVAASSAPSKGVPANG